MASQIVPVIMCGGAGTRLWPVSRESMPKQFVSLVGPRSTFQQVLARVADADLFGRPIVITKADFRFVVAEQLRECGIEADIVLEPMRRDSGPAVATAAVLAAERDRDALVLVVAADHVIRKPEAFRDACRSAAAAAAQGRIVTFGIEPTRPVTSYGYIRPGEQLNGGSVRAVEAFVEKPDAGTAAKYVADGYLWNSGNFLFRAATMLGDEPAMAKAVKSAVAGLTRDLDFLRLAARAVRPRPQEVDRLRRDGAHGARGGGARRPRLVRCRRLELGLGAPRRRLRSLAERTLRPTAYPQELIAGLVDGVLDRLDEITRRQPKTVFLMIGVNDLGLGISPQIVERNIQSIVSALLRSGIKPIVQSTLFVTNNPEINAKIQRLDEALHKWRANSSMPLG